METPITPISRHQGPPKSRLQVPPRPPAAVFFATTFVAFILSLSAADSIGFVPNYIDGTEPVPRADSISLADLPPLGYPPVSDTSVADATQPGILPERIQAPSIGLDLIVQNPSTKDVDALDTDLKKGPVRYVVSAALGEPGNMLIFAHSSHLPIVHNQMYRAFNRINELKAGDSITVSGGGTDYIYSVTNVRLTDANEEVIDLSTTNGTHLTLSTCDTFGKKSSRWVVEADLVGTVPSAN